LEIFVAYFNLQFQNPFFAPKPPQHQPRQQHQPQHVDPPTHFSPQLARECSHSAILQVDCAKHPALQHPDLEQNRGQTSCLEPSIINNKIAALPQSLKQVKTCMCAIWQAHIENNQTNTRAPTLRLRGRWRIHPPQNLYRTASWQWLGGWFVRLQAAKYAWCAIVTWNSKAQMKPEFHTTSMWLVQHLAWQFP
jgi:hypothetical protein